MLRPPSSSAGPFPRHLARILVPPEPQEPRMAEPSIRGPFRESNLRDETRPHPVHFLPRKASPRKRGPVLLEGGQLSAQRGEERVVEPGSNLSRIQQVLPLVVAD